MNTSANNSLTTHLEFLDSIKIYHNADLTSCNTMQLSCIADTVIELNQESDIDPTITKLQQQNLPIFILSGGSNIIFPKVLHAAVIKPTFKGINTISETADTIEIEVMAGENWHNLVVSCVDKGWYGLENLALIPGLVGAAPVQNIGAYGIQLDDLLCDNSAVKAYHIPSHQWHVFNKNECQFNYRDSKFKKEAGDWLISRVRFKLHKDNAQVNANYGDVSSLALNLAQENKREYITPVDVMNAIIAIRQSKLPDPKILPNCGSFFKNPIISTEQFLSLQQQFPEIVGYKVNDTHTKVAAGWLIDKAGLKNNGIAPILTHAKQALVLVNHSRPNNQKIATQADILATQQFIQQHIKEKFNINLEREPVWVDAQGRYNNQL